MTRLELLRRSRGFTQAQLADATGVPRTRISLLECGRAIPPRGGVELSSLARFFHIPLGEADALLDNGDLEAVESSS